MPHLPLLINVYFFVFSSHQSFTPDSLSSAINDAAQDSPSLLPVNFKTIFDSWHTQPGIPKLTVQYDRKTGSIHLTQARLVRDNSSYSEDESTWWIPYNFITSHESGKSEFQSTAADGWISEDNKILISSEARNLMGAQWVLFNKEATGYYFINYDNDNWNALAETLRTKSFGNIHFMNRYQLLYDSFYFAEYDESSYEIPLKLATYLVKHAEMNLGIWSMISDGILHIQWEIMGTEFYPEFEVSR